MFCFYGYCVPMNDTLSLDFQFDAKFCSMSVFDLFQNVGLDNYILNTKVELLGGVVSCCH
jgi:hypothetical protein